MKNDIKKYLTLGAVLAGSAFMVSCDGDSYSLATPTAEELEAAKNKPVAPVPLALYPLTSLKLTFDSDSGSCLGQTFDAGVEVEFDFDSTDVTSATDTSANGLADLTIDGTIIFGILGGDVYVENINNVGPIFTIDFIKEGTDSNGEILLSDLTFTPLASDLRSITGRFSGISPVDVNVNQDTTNVVGDSGALPLNNLTLPDGSSEPVEQVTIYQDVNGNPAEITTLGGVVLDSEIGEFNVVLSVELQNGCVLNFVLSKAEYIAVGNVAVFEDSTNVEVQTAFNNLNSDLSAALVGSVLDVSPVGDQIPDTAAVIFYLTAGNGGEAITGTYRHDFDSSTGSPEPIINSSPLDLQAILNNFNNFNNIP